MPYTKKHPSYTFLKGSVYYFSKSVPIDLRQHYRSSRIVQSLRTTSPRVAAEAANILNVRLQEYWRSLRFEKEKVPGLHLLVSYANSLQNNDLPSIQCAKEFYLDKKGGGRGNTFESHTERAIKYLIECLGDRPLDQYTTRDACKLRDWLSSRGLKTASIRRNFNSIKALVSFCANESGLQISNPFSGVYLPSDEQTEKRLPIPLSAIRMMQKACFRQPDELRLVAALISDSGMRLSEALGLKSEDIDVTGSVPFVRIKNHPHRRLKTLTSVRTIPLVGSSLRAAKLILEKQSEYCFPRYTSGETCRSNSASAALNKWIKTVAGETSVIHGLRHSFRDRLRSVETPVEIIDQLGGWSKRSSGQEYGNGYTLETLCKWMTIAMMKN